MTSGSLAAVRTPLHFASDRECLELLAGTVGKFDPTTISVGWIRNTLDLGTLAVSQNLLAEIEQNSMLTVTGKPFDLEFDADGNLPKTIPD
jgi:hypothetical protein